MSDQPERLPWRKEHDLGEDDVRLLLEERFPELAPVTLRLIGEGWDSEAYLVNDELIFRMPKRTEVVAWQEHERCFLARFAERLPLPTPRFEWISTPTDRYPFPFAGYRKLPGIPAIELLDNWSSLDHITIARQLGKFFSTLHAIPVDDARACGLNTTEEEDWSNDRLWGKREAHVESVRRFNSEISDSLSRWFDTSTPAPVLSVPFVSLHADLGPEHLMIDPDTGALSGVIDWADACIGPAVGDLVGCVVWFGVEFLHHVLGEYDGNFNEADHPWLIERSILVALAHIDYGGQTGRAEYLRLGLHTLDHLLPSQS